MLICDWCFNWKMNTNILEYIILHNSTIITYYHIKLKKILLDLILTTILIYHNIKFLNPFSFNEFQSFVTL